MGIKFKYSRSLGIDMQIDDLLKRYDAVILATGQSNLKFKGIKYKEKGIDINTQKGLRDRAVIELLFSTGLRVSELCSLNRDLNISADEFPIRGKGEKVRVVFLSESSKKYLKK